MSIRIYNETVEGSTYIVYITAWQFTMDPRDRSFYSEHFFFSNRLVQLLLGLHNNKNSKVQLIVFFTIIAFIFLGVVQQVNVSFLNVHIIISFIIIIIIDYLFFLNQFLWIKFQTWSCKHFSCKHNAMWKNKYYLFFF